MRKFAFMKQRNNCRVLRPNHSLDCVVEICEECILIGKRARTVMVVNTDFEHITSTWKSPRR